MHSSLSKQLKLLRLAVVVFSLYSCSCNRHLDTKVEIIVSTFSKIRGLQANVGQNIITKGFYKEGDKGAAQYVVSATGEANDLNIVELRNGNFAHLVLGQDSFLNVNHLGIFGLGSREDKRILNNAMRYNSKIFIPKGEYNLGSEVFLGICNSIRGESGSIYSRNVKCKIW